MRNRFERQLLELNNELIQMGSMIERAIEMGISALVRQDVEKAKKAIAYDEEIDERLSSRRKQGKHPRAERLIDAVYGMFSIHLIPPALMLPHLSAGHTFSHNDNAGSPH